MTKIRNNRKYKIKTRSARGGGLFGSMGDGVRRGAKGTRNKLGKSTKELRSSARSIAGSGTGNMGKRLKRKQEALTKKQTKYTDAMESTAGTTSVKKFKRYDKLNKKAEAKQALMTKKKDQLDAYAKAKQDVPTSRWAKITGKGKAERKVLSAQRKSVMKSMSAKTDRKFEKMSKITDVHTAKLSALKGVRKSKEGIMTKRFSRFRPKSLETKTALKELKANKKAIIKDKNKNEINELTGKQTDILTKRTDYKKGKAGFGEASLEDKHAFIKKQRDLKAGLSPKYKAKRAKIDGAKETSSVEPASTQATSTQTAQPADATTSVESTFV
jgi:hypothetical protein